jgi:3-hydroxybutyryl-CoA dehydrogenase
MTQKEISGWDGMANAAREIYPSLSNTSTLPPKVEQLMKEGKTGMKAGEGDAPGAGSRRCGGAVAPSKRLR